MSNKLIIDPNMENQEIWNIYISKNNLKRKYLELDGVLRAIELSKDTLHIIAEKRKQTLKRSFDRYHEKHREQYNEFYRLRYHEKVKDVNIENKPREKNYEQEYRVKNKEKIQKYQEEYRQRKREEAKLLKGVKENE